MRFVILYLILFFQFTTLLAQDIVLTFQDSNLLNAIIQQKVDQNGDGKIQVTEALKVKETTYSQCWNYLYERNRRFFSAQNPGLQQ